MGEFVMRHRFDGLFTLRCLILFLVSSCVALADPIAEADKPLPNVETGGPLPEADSKRTTEKPSGSDPQTRPIPLRGAVPTASDRAGELTGRDMTVESSDQTGALTPAPVPAPVPAGKTQLLVTDPVAAGMAKPMPTPNSDQPPQQLPIQSNNRSWNLPQPWWQDQPRQQVPIQTSRLRSFLQRRSPHPY